MDKILENKLRKKVSKILEEFLFENNEVETEICITCGGQGYINGETCMRCGGEGDIPKNVEDIFNKIGGDAYKEDEISEEEERGKLRVKKLKPAIKPMKAMKPIKKIKPPKPLKPLKPKLHPQTV